MPIVIVMLLWAGLFGKIKPRATKPDELWNLAHRLSSFTGVAAFGVAAGVGTMYLLARASSGAKPPSARRRWGVWNGWKT